MINSTIIYLVTNINNNPNKVYIGKTKDSRENKHKKSFGSQITYTYIDEVNSLNKEDWEPLETKWIQHYINLGYDVVNIRRKGGSGPEYLSEETKQKISKSLLGQTRSEETKQKMRKPKPEGFSEFLKKFHSNKITSEATKNKMSLAHKDRPKSEETKQKMRKPKPEGFSSKISRPVIQYTLDNKIISIYKSIKEACASINKPKREGDITSVCQGKQKTAFGFIWKYCLEG